LPNTAISRFPNIDGETLVGHLDRAGYAVASGAACSSANPEPSHVLRAMGCRRTGAWRGAGQSGCRQYAGTDRWFPGTLQATVLRLQQLTAMAV
jgi:cysteine desulfurase